MSYTWLKEEKSPKILVEAVKHIGTKEIVGKQHNKKILEWAEAIGLKSVYTNVNSFSVLIFVLSFNFNELLSKFSSKCGVIRN